MGVANAVRLFFGLSSTGITLKQDVGRLPAMGWNSWNAYGCDINQDKMMEAAQALVDLGLKDAGYNYVNIDDCWSVKDGRDQTTNRIVPDLTKFPDGINGTASKVHDMDLLLGIYSSAGNTTCGGYPASLGYEDVDAQAWAEWGVDYLKYDNCGYPSSFNDDCDFCWLDRQDGPNGTCIHSPDSNIPLCPANYDYSQSKTAKRYQAMSDALLKTDRNILYSLCEWGTQDVISWGNQTAHSWRTTNDINPSWERILAILNENSFMTHATDFYGHNDPDMLEVGNGNLTLAECRSHFAFWAAMKGPLLIGTDLKNLTSDLVDVLKNPILIGFNQDPVIGQAAAPFHWGTNADWTFNASYPAEYWAGKSSNGTLVLMLNTADETVEKSTAWSAIDGLDPNGQYSVIDAWTGELVDCCQGGIAANVSSHDTAAFLVQGTCS